MLTNYTLIDLTHSLSSKAPTWTGSCGFSIEVKQDHDKGFRVDQMKMHAGIGTHIDSPLHLVEGGASASEIPLEQLVVPACLINVSTKADAEYQVSVKDLLEYETKHGQIADKSLILIYTGWSRFWPDPEIYRGNKKKGQTFYPSLASDAAEYLLSRNISGIAIDTLSPDCPHTNFPVHHLLLKAGKYIIENMGSCAKVPPKGSFAVAFPMKTPSSESPIRLAVFIPNSTT